jgi:hypothetical protein
MKDYYLPGCRRLMLATGQIFSQQPPFQITTTDRAMYVNKGNP